MSESTNGLDAQFFQLVLSLQAAAMQQMGKVMSPITGKIERDLTAAKTSIDMIEMIQRKTEGNLTEDETKLINHVLYELRLNYVDESAKPENDSTETDEGEREASASPSEEEKAQEGQAGPDGKDQGGGQ